MPEEQQRAAANAKASQLLDLRKRMDEATGNVAAGQTATPQPLRAAPATAPVAPTLAPNRGQGRPTLPPVHRPSKSDQLRALQAPRPR
jgi:hypothetical protein